jgi:hypothetical protein
VFEDAHAGLTLATESDRTPIGPQNSSASFIGTKYAANGQSGGVLRFYAPFRLKYMCELTIFWTLRPEGKTAFTACVRLFPLFPTFIGTPQNSERKECENNFPA